MPGDKTTCTCSRCVQACKDNPGWFMPDEAEAALAAGLALNLMRDWLEPSSTLGNTERIYLLAPASEGCEGDDAPDFEDFSFLDWMFHTPTKGRCVLLGETDRCTIHDSGFKPFQCREALPCGAGQNTAVFNNFVVAKAWDTDKGRALVQLWQQKVST